MSPIAKNIKHYTDTLHHLFQAYDEANKFPLMGDTVCRDLNTLIDLTSLSMLDYMNKELANGDWEIYKENDSYHAMHMNKANEVDLGKIEDARDAVDISSKFVSAIRANL